MKMSRAIMLVTSSAMALIAIVTEFTRSYGPSPVILPPSPVSQRIHQLAHVATKQPYIPHVATKPPATPPQIANEKVDMLVVPSLLVPKVTTRRPTALIRLQNASSPPIRRTARTHIAHHKPRHVTYSARRHPAQARLIAQAPRLAPPVETPPTVALEPEAPSTVSQPRRTLKQKISKLWVGLKSKFRRKPPASDH